MSLLAHHYYASYIPSWQPLKVLSEAASFLTTDYRHFYLLEHMRLWSDSFILVV